MKNGNIAGILFQAILALLSTFLICGDARAQRVGEALDPWSEGTLDIHQISTGKGNAAFFVLPDGTTLLVDAGSLGSRTARHVDPTPNDSRTPGEWLVRYIKRIHPDRENASLDYAFLTHFHGDHMGQIRDDSPLSRSGRYRLSGITEVAEHVNIRKMIDRGWPDYSFPSPLEGGSIKNYRQFLDWQSSENGMAIERFVPGRNDQFVLLNKPEKYPEFEIRNIVANGEVWTGVAENTRKQFPVLKEIPREEWPSENPCSAGFRLSYGSFDYFTGGDITGIPSLGGPSWHDIETPVAMAVGPVEAAVMNHHGYIDSQNSFYVSTLRPLVWILSVWDSAHPTSAVFARISSKRLYPGPRDIFTTGMHPANKVVISGLNDIASDQGHILIRVAPGGNSFKVIVLDNSSESMTVKSVHGPYQSR